MIKINTQANQPAITQLSDVIKGDDLSTLNQYNDSTLKAVQLDGCDGGTLIHVAAHYNAIGCLKYLIEREICSPNQLDDVEVSPLMVAIRQGQQKAVEYLWALTNYTAKTKHTNDDVFVAAARLDDDLFNMVQFIYDRDCEDCFKSKEKITLIQKIASKKIAGGVKALLLAKIDEHKLRMAIPPVSTTNPSNTSRL